MNNRALQRVIASAIAFASFFVAPGLFAQCFVGTIPNFRTASGSAGNRSITVAWDAPSGVSNPTYEVLMKTASTPCALLAQEQFSVVTTTTSRTATVNVPADIAFGVYVRLAGCNDLKTQFTLVYDSITTLPAPPRIVSVTPGFGQVSISAVVDDNRAYGITVDRFDGTNSNFVGFMFGCPTGSTKTITDFGPGGSSGNPQLKSGTYTYVVFTDNAAGVTPVFVTATVTGQPAPNVSATRLPTGMVQIVGLGTPSDTLTLVNTGDGGTSINLTREGDFFNFNPGSFSLGPGASQTVSITPATTNSGNFTGAIKVSGAGVPSGLSIPVKLFSTTRPNGSVLGSAAANRVDVASQGNTGNGVARFTNSSKASTTLKGIIASDVPWIIPPGDVVFIPPGQTLDVPFTIDRSKRPDAAALTGSLTGTLSLVYPLGTSTVPAKMQREPFDSAGTLAAPIAIVDTAKPPTNTSILPALQPGEIALAIPGVGNITGSVGQFISDASIVNKAPTLSISDLKIFYTSGTTSVAANQSLAGSYSLGLADVVNTVFNQSEQIGTLHLRTKDILNLAVGANVFNKSNLRGTFGTAIPVFRSDRGITSGQTLYLTGLRKTPTSHTNLYLQEMTGSAANVQITFYAENGSTIGTLSNQTVDPFGIRIIPQSSVPEGAVSAVVTNSSGGSVVSYATPVDRASGDTWAVTDWNKYNGLTGSEPMLIPVAGAAPGRNNTYFTTDLAITNSGTSSGTGTLRYYQQIPAVAQFDRSITLAPRQSFVATDVVTTFFNVPAGSLGYIVFTPASGRTFSVTSRTYTTLQGDVQTFGTGVPTLPLSGGIRAGQSKIIGGLKDSTAATTNAATPGTFRTNVGLVETAGSSANIRVSVLFNDGRQLAGGGAQATRNYSLAAREFKQLNAIVSEVMGSAVREASFGNLDNVQVKVEVLSGSGAVAVYATSTDNGTGDTVLRTE